MVRNVHQFKRQLLDMVAEHQTDLMQRIEQLAVQLDEQADLSGFEKGETNPNMDVGEKADPKPVIANLMDCESAAEPKESDMQETSTQRIAAPHIDKDTESMQIDVPANPIPAPPPEPVEPEEDQHQSMSQKNIQKPKKRSQHLGLSPSRIESFVQKEEQNDINFAQMQMHMHINPRPTNWFHEPARTGYLASLVTSRSFDCFMMVVILANLVFAWIEADYQMYHKTWKSSGAMQVTDGCFLGIYTIEVALRLATHRLYFFVNEDYKWNLFDFSLVLMGYSFVLSNEIETDFLRTMRILRVTNKIIRVVKLVHFISELKLMLQCVLGSLRPLFWALVLLMGFTLLFSILLVEQFTKSVVKDGGKVFSTPELDMVQDSFGSVFKTIISLFKAISGGADWGDFYELTSKTGALGAFVFLSYILVTWMSITNIITSIFIDCAMKMAQPDTDDRALEKRKADMHTMQELERIFKSVDKDQSNTISLEELRACLDDVRIATFLEVEGLSVSDAEMFYFLLTAQAGTNKVDLSSFISGWLRMRGTASSLDLLSFQHEVSLFNTKFDKSLTECRQDLTRLKEDLWILMDYSRV